MFFYVYLNVVFKNKKEEKHPKLPPQKNPSN